MTHLTQAIQAKKYDTATYMRRYRAKHPWAKYYSYAAGRKRNGILCKMTTADFKELWNRDKAWLLKRPSIDRIDPRRDYEKDNCRFIEESLNKSLGARAQTGHKSARQIAASRDNLSKWRHSNPPHNKGVHKQERCDIKDCPRPYRAGGKCAPHYQQAQYKKRKHVLS